ncbi:Coenzyme F420 hydrogenase/dehydrogenase, beta subunit C-terminal domain [Breznakiella homolactica]|uniref:Coenzyme F420 hydrogenase/dehydrogenase, beta subunit C-terminal domain n=1 Tax=Breznakiella homolactica TaxID=2798577 RepID=A0A7T7XNF3_9SPIR|nr:Coenzyme F420 hydrogenase/dehydrogenase, beta subunit C-terminal domain [Breznakiella homolactica]QQO09565.1 Coenzyme F420 hydrogenase/dehydrogenase, beta subunit C-terminal domain [Breznakiella homolactica]
MESVFSKKHSCSGCGACESICPAAAITMLPDEEGFLYPLINRTACVGCGKCVVLCPFRKKDHYKSEAEPSCYALRHKSAEVLKQSTSGGAFTAFSDSVLALGGIVYGAVFDGDLRVVHRRASTPEERNAMRFSKYVQSDLRGICRDIGNDLAAGKKVLFTGTPCQSAGIRAVFPADSNLFLCDVICHSVPSPRVWEDYKKLLETECRGKLSWVQFRSKKYPWNRANSNKGFLYKISGEDDDRGDDRFYTLFINGNAIVRPSCYRCPFADIKRTSDITMADYFGIEKSAPNFYDPLGVSLVLVNTPQGKNLLGLSAAAASLEERPVCEALSLQQRLSAPGPEPPDRKDFWKQYHEAGLSAVIVRNS